jgi:hypothetical protein
MNILAPHATLLIQLYAFVAKNNTTSFVDSQHRHVKMFAESFWIVANISVRRFVMLGHVNHVIKTQKE